MRYRRKRGGIGKYRHSVLTGAAIVGVFAGGYLCAKGGMKAETLLAERRRELGRELFWKESASVVYKAFIPAVVVQLMTVCCIGGAYHVSEKQKAALIAGCAALGKKYTDYRQQVIETCGSEVDNQIMEKVEKAKDVYLYSSDIMGTSSLHFDGDLEETVTFYEPYSERKFESTIGRVLQALYHLNRNFILSSGVTLNEYYDMLGLESVFGGDDKGWGIMDDMYWIDFNIVKRTLDDGMEFYEIQMLYEPTKESLMGEELCPAYYQE